MMIQYVSRSTGFTSLDCECFHTLDTTFPNSSMSPWNAFITDNMNSFTLIEQCGRIVMVQVIISGVKNTL